ncbi:ycf3-interacting protein 1, chloroplastic isoform X1 [Rosa rugosa]|uniref:ycf3-interacting protein 1, chloroplastic isoform X1 n=1 Tax=Rosa rugosa TaxID=74645 RepID=UPI002B407CAF|nr:ycf3-interacting protein 1, chloroplastic isoform X1 [Rosa rugosa]
MMMTSSQMLQVAPLASHAYSSSSSSSSQTLPVWFNHCHCHPSRPQLTLRHRPRSTILLAGNPDRKLQVSSSPSSSWTTQQDQDDEEDEEDEDDDQEEEEESDPTPDDLEYISQIKRVLELLKNNRDMIFNEVKLTIAIEDIREVERRRLLGIEDPDAPTREELAAVLEEVHEGKIPKNRLALKLLAEEMNRWPNLEVQIKPAKKKPGKSLYARVTDTGIDLKEAAKRLNIDWDTAAEIDDADVKDESDVPSVVGYGALYLVTLFPVIIGVSVVLILFYNSLQ